MVFPGRAALGRLVAGSPGLAAPGRLAVLALGHLHASSAVPIALRCVVLCCVVLRCVALCSVVLRCVALCCIVLLYVALCCFCVYKSGGGVQKLAFQRLLGKGLPPAQNGAPLANAG